MILTDYCLTIALINCDPSPVRFFTKEIYNLLDKDLMYGIGKGEKYAFLYPNTQSVSVVRGWGHRQVFNYKDYDDLIKKLK